MSRSAAVAAAVAVAVAACGPVSPSPKSTHVAAPGKRPGESTRGTGTANANLPSPEPPALRLPDDVVPTAYRVRWIVDANKDGFAGHVDIDVKIERATDHVWLNAVGLAITAPAYTIGAHDDRLVALDKRTDDVVGFRFAGALAAGTAATLHLDFAGKLGANDFAGLFREQDTGRWYLYSQFESSFARRAMPSFDEPRWKTPWTVTLVVPTGQQAFSNTPIHKVTPSADGTLELEFEPTPPLPSYLVAIAVGPFETVDAGTVGKHKVPARIIVPAGHAAEASYAARTTGDVVAALEDYFDMPLPLAKLDQIAVPHFFGAMENPGLITYQASIILSHGKETDDFRHQFIWISGHELAHQWFGDLVTLAWWDDLWLNESFATWMADKVGSRLDPHWDAAIRNADETEKAMQADAAPDARALHREIRGVSDIEGSFDAISYEKGGAVLSMFEHWVGPDKFRDGVRGYLAKHARGTATQADFLAGIAGVASPEVRDAFLGFLDQPGVPLVRASLRCAAGAKPVLALTQERLGDAHGTAAWKVPLCVRTIANAHDAPGREQCQLIGASATIELDAAACPLVVDANSGAAGYYRVLYDDALGARLIKNLQLLAPAERLALAGDTSALVDSGDVDLGRALDLARALLARKDPHAELAAVELIARTGMLVDDAHRPAWRRWVIAQLGARARAIGFAPAMGADEVTARARTRLLEVDGVAAQDPRLGAEARRLAAGWLSGKRTIDPADLDLILEVAAVGGDAALFERIATALAKAKDPDEQDALVGAIAAFRDPALAGRAIDVFLEPDLDIRTAGHILEGLFSHAETQDAAWKVLHDRFDAMVARLPRFIAGYIALAPAGFCDGAHRKDAEDFLRPRVAELSSGERALGQALATIDRCIALRARNADAVARYFAK